MGLLIYELQSTGKGRFVSGHYPINFPICRAYGERWQFITIIRHPVERYLSQYFFNLNSNRSFRVSTSLKEFIETERGTSWGHQYVRQLAFSSDKDELGDEVKAVDAACRVLDGFTVVGCLENLDDFVTRFENAFAVRLNIPRRNIGHVDDMEKRAAITPKVRQRIEEICEPDLRVYQHVQEQLLG